MIEVIKDNDMDLNFYEKGLNLSMSDTLKQRTINGYSINFRDMILSC